MATTHPICTWGLQTCEGKGIFMPIYEYRCAGCKKNFELIQKFSDDPHAACPKCGKKAKRLISQTSFLLKGGGWYKDGYSGKSVGEKTEKTAEKKTEKPAEAPKSETKKSEKAEKKP